MEAKLIVVGGKASKGALSLKLPTIIGRSREARLTIAHPMISRRHCELFEVDGLLMIRDMESLNGTLVDGQRIKEAPLPPDAEFTIGPLTLRAQYEYAGDLATLPAPVLAEKKEKEAVSSDQSWSDSPESEADDDAQPFDPQTIDVAEVAASEAEGSFFEELGISDGDAPTPDIAQWDDEAQRAVESPGDDIEEPDELIETDEESGEESSSSASPKTPTVWKKKKGPWLAGLLKGSKKKKAKKSAAASATEKVSVSDAEDDVASVDDVEEPDEAAPPTDEEPTDDFFPEPSSKGKPTKKTNDDPFDDFLDGLT